MKENDFQLVAAGQARSEIFMSDFNSKLSYKEKLLVFSLNQRERESALNDLEQETNR